MNSNLHTNRDHEGFLRSTSGSSANVKTHSKSETKRIYRTSNNKVKTKKLDKVHESFVRPTGRSSEIVKTHPKSEMERTYRTINTKVKIKKL